jgi:hypothetical protein
MICCRFGALAAIAIACLLLVGECIDLHAFTSSSKKIYNPEPCRRLECLKASRPRPASLRTPAAARCAQRTSRGRDPCTRPVSGSSTGFPVATRKYLRIDLVLRHLLRRSCSPLRRASSIADRISTEQNFFVADILMESLFGRFVFLFFHFLSLIRHPELVSGSMLQHGCRNKFGMTVAHHIPFTSGFFCIGRSLRFGRPRRIPGPAGRIRYSQALFPVFLRREFLLAHSDRPGNAPRTSPRTLLHTAGNNSFSIPKAFRDDLPLLRQCIRKFRSAVIRPGNCSYRNASLTSFLDSGGWLSAGSAAAGRRLPIFSTPCRAGA